VYITGEVVSPAIAVVDTQALTILVDALAVPESIEIDVEGKEEGAAVHAGDVALPAGAELVTDAELLVVAVQIPRVEEEPEDEVEDTEDEAAEEGTSEEE
jgi:large subunit ribosomal protein L25